VTNRLRHLCYLPDGCNQKLTGRCTLPQKNLFNSLADEQVPAAGLFWHQKLTRQKFNESNHTPASPSQTTVSLVLQLHHYSYSLSGLLLAI
jgi:hypothetical protein